MTLLSVEEKPLPFEVGAFLVSGMWYAWSMKATILGFRDYVADSDIQDFYEILREYLVEVGEDTYWFGQTRGDGIDETMIEWDIVEDELSRIVEWDGMVIGDAEVDISKWLESRGYEVEVGYGKVRDDDANTSRSSES